MLSLPVPAAVTICSHKHGSANDMAKAQRERVEEQKRSSGLQTPATPKKNTCTRTHGVYTELSTHASTLEWFHISKGTQMQWPDLSQRQLLTFTAPIPAGDKRSVPKSISSSLTLKNRCTNKIKWHLDHWEWKYGAGQLFDMFSELMNTWSCRMMSSSSSNIDFSKPAWALRVRSAEWQKWEVHVVCDDLF